MRHFNAVVDLTAAEMAEIFDRATRLKTLWAAGRRPPLLAGRVLTQIFEKPSLRTRVSFEAAMIQLGGGVTFMSGKDAGLEGRESPADIARVVGGYSDVIVLRTFSQQLIDTFVAHAPCSVINGLSDQRHPCQALTDVFTMLETIGPVRDRKIVFVGDGNNVAASLAAATTLAGAQFVVCAPEGYRIRDEYVAEIRKRIPGASIEQTSNFKSALKGAAIVYTDVWASMGQEDQEAQRQKILGPYQVNAKLMSMAPSDCRFMHCLPAKRGKETTDDVLDGSQSVVFQQAENRMHLAKGLFTWALEVAV